MSLPSAIAEPTAEHARGAAPTLRPVAVWLLSCCGMIFAMVVIGGITRLTLSGLSIPEWQLVTGILPPLSAGAWIAEFEKAPQLGIIRREIEFLPDEALEQGRIIWQAIDDLCGCEPVPLKLQLEGGHVSLVRSLSCTEETKHRCIIAPKQ